MACAETGGVVGVNGIGIFLGDNEATIDNIVKHIDYLVELVGPEHVGIGLDYVFDQQEVNDFVKQNPHIFPPEEGYAKGLEMLAPSAIPHIIQGLAGLGYTDEDLRKIMGGFSNKRPPISGGRFQCRTIARCDQAARAFTGAVNS